MENNDDNNTNYLQWVLMADPSVDLTALSPPNVQSGTDSLPNMDLLNYILGNEAVQPSSAPSLPSLTANDGSQPIAITIPSTPIPITSAGIMEDSTALSSLGFAADSSTTTTTTRISSDNSTDGITHVIENKHHSDEDDDEIPESRLKMMTSKERRQLRNKISARKFRNRRKEYITMLETEVQKQKTENSRLRLEVTWIRGTIDKLQKENDQLRLELVLCKEGIKPRRTQDSIKETSTMPASSLSNCAVATTAITAAATIDVQTSSLSPPSLDGGCMAFGHSDQSSTSSHSPNSSNPSPPPLITDDFVEPWDFVLPDQNYQLTRPQNTYLSYAVMPEWDLPNILDKGSETTALMPANQLIQRYPLLVPALMSIILGHTMTMTAEELVSHTKLLTSPSPLLVPLDESCEDGHLASHHSVNAFWFGPKPIKSNKATKIPTGEELHSIWEAQQLRREMSLETWYNEKADEQHQVAQTAPDYCPLTWLQKQFCRFVYAQIISRYPQLEQPCKVYLPICDKIIQRTTPLSG